MNDDEVELVLNSDSVTFTMWHNNSKVSVPCYIKLQHKEVILVQRTQTFILS